MSKTLTTHFGLNHLDATLLADDAAMLHALVLAADTLVVFDRPEDLRAKKSVSLGLESTIINGLWLFYLAM